MNMKKAILVILLCATPHNFAGGYWSQPTPPQTDEVTVPDAKTLKERICDQTGISLNFLESMQFSASFEKQTLTKQQAAQKLDVLFENRWERVKINIPTMYQYETKQQLDEQRKQYKPVLLNVLGFQNSEEKN